MKSAKRLNFLAISEQAGWGDSLKRALSSSSYRIQIDSIDAFIPIHRYLLRSLPHAILLSAELNESVIMQVSETVDRISAGLPVCMVGKREGTSSIGLPLYMHPEKGEPDVWISRVMSSGNAQDMRPTKMRIMQQLNQSIEALEQMDSHHRGGAPGGYSHEIRSTLLSSRRRLEILQDRMRKK